MTDNQFNQYVQLRNENEELRKEIEHLQIGSTGQNCDGMTDYQFKRFVEILNERDALRKENKELLEKYDTLTQEINRMKKDN